jgi:hypothetical protein
MEGKNHSLTPHSSQLFQWVRIGSCTETMVSMRESEHNEAK